MNMKSLRSVFLRQDHVCPWWLAYTFDNPLRRFLHDPREMFGSLVREGMTVADIGCGMGYFTIALAGMVGRSGTVFAVDLQQKMLDMMQKRAAKACMADRIIPLHATEDDIMLRTPVDFTLAFWVVHEVRNIPRFFRQVSSILARDGKILYAEPKMHVNKQRFREILDHARKAGFLVVDAPQVRFSRAAVLVKTQQPWTGEQADVLGNR